MALMLSSCAPADDGKRQSNTYEAPAPAKPKMFEEHYQKLDDGRTVLCLYKQADGYGYAKATMSCDWATAMIMPAK